ncbi:MAG TPA: hypothetical protein VKW78_06710 [Terriglobales bacterium]|nr:hypothetical protein [Terriglobales bacterium]
MRVSTPPVPTYVRKFQSNKDIVRPSRLQVFALRMSGLPPNEDRTISNREQWDVNPTTHPRQFVIDSPHVVRPSSSLATSPALSAFGQALADPFASHELFMARPSAVITDSDNRILIADPLARAIHVYDLEANRYFRLQGGEGRRLQMPSGVAVDTNHNIYVTDLDLGMILVYTREGRFQRYIGSRATEGGIFYRPSSIAIDAVRGHIYVPDTPRHMVVVLDLKGNILTHIGRPDLLSLRLLQRDGGIREKGKTQLPTDVVIRDDKLFVLGRSTVQIFDLNGRLIHEFPVSNDYAEASGLAVDAESHIYISDGIRSLVRAYDSNGAYLYSFGQQGTKHGEFFHPRGLWVDGQNRLYVADSSNGRVQVFQLHLARQRSGTAISENRDQSGAAQ